MRPSAPWLGAIVLALLVLEASSPAFLASQAYASAGAFASYTAEGGFIPYFAGVQGNITYSVESVFSNGTMAIRVFVNITAGAELNPKVGYFNFTDSVGSPRTFPAVPPSALATNRIEFQNVSATFLKNQTLSVPAGTFNTMEFQGIGANNTATNFWFDPGTGLMIQEGSGTSAIELDSSNIAVPMGPPAGFGGEVPYELTFVIAFAVGGVLFLYIRYHYTRQAAKKAKSKPAPSDRR